MRVQEGVSSGKSSRAKGGAHLFLDRQLDAQPFRMRLGPDETGIDESDFGEALEFPEADCEQFARLEFAAGPLSRRREVALAASAKVDGRLLRDALGDVDAVGSRQERERSGQQNRHRSHAVYDDARVSETVDAEVGAVGLDRRSTVCTGACQQCGMSRRKKDEMSEEVEGLTCTQDVGGLARGTSVSYTCAHDWLTGLAGSVA